jgi:hypothetical protein
MKTLLPCCAALLAALAWLAAPAGAGELRDPTRPPLAFAAGRRESAPVLSAVMSTGRWRGAIFNGEFVRSGGSVDGYTIEAVLVDGVRYRHAGRTTELHLPQTLNMIKKPATGPARATSGANP